MSTPAIRHLESVPAPRTGVDDAAGALASVTALFPDLRDPHEGDPAAQARAYDTASPSIDLTGFVELRTSDNYVQGQVKPDKSRKPVKYTATIPSQPASPYVHVIVPGLGGHKTSSRGWRNAETVDQDFVAVSYNPSRNGGAVSDLLNPQQLHVDTISAIIDDLFENPQFQDSAAAEVVDRSHVVLDVHSMGILPVLRYALAHPSNVQLINLVETIGLETAPVGFGFLPRLKPTMLEAIVPAIINPKESSYMFGMRALAYYARNPLRTASEMVSCMLADSAEELRALGELGVKRSLTLGGKDVLVPSASSFEKGAMLDYCEIVPDFTHFAPQKQSRLVAARIGAISRLFAPAATASLS